MTRTSYTITVTKAANGWIINERDDNPIVVPEGESLGDHIAAAIAAARLESDQQRSMKLLSQQRREWTQQDFERILQDKYRWVVSTGSLVGETSTSATILPSIFTLK